MAKKKEKAIEIRKIIDPAIKAGEIHYCCFAFLCEVKKIKSKKLVPRTVTLKNVDHRIKRIIAEQSLKGVVSVKIESQGIVGFSLDNQQKKSA